MDLRQLQFVVAVAETLSFTEAAARCAVAQSTLSAQVAQLECELGVPLFHRTSRSVRPAPALVLLLPRARALLRDAAAAREEIAAFAGVFTGRLRMGVLGGSAFGMPFFDRAVVAFHERYPGVEMVMEDSGSLRTVQKVRCGELDLALVGLAADQCAPDVEHHLVRDEPLVAIVPVGHPLAGAERVGLAELAAAAAFIEPPRESGIRMQIDAAFTRAGIQRTVAFELSSPPAVVHFVALGLGAALMPAGPAEQVRDVAVLSLDDPSARHPIGLVHRPAEQLSPAARAFVRLLLDELG